MPGLEATRTSTLVEAVRSHYAFEALVVGVLLAKEVMSAGPNNTAATTICVAIATEE
jgi:hypothetical protein